MFAAFLDRFVSGAGRLADGGEPLDSDPDDQASFPGDSSSAEQLFRHPSPVAVSRPAKAIAFVTGSWYPRWAWHGLGMNVQIDRATGVPREVRTPWAENQPVVMLPQSTSGRAAIFPLTEDMEFFE